DSPSSNWSSSGPGRLAGAGSGRSLAVVDRSRVLCLPRFPDTQGAQASARRGPVRRHPPMAQATKLTVTAKLRLDGLPEDSDVLARMVSTAASDPIKTRAGLL